MSTFKPQFFSDGAQILKDSKGSTHTGIELLVFSHPTPEGWTFDEDAKWWEGESQRIARWEANVNRIVEALRDLSEMGVMVGVGRGDLDAEREGGE